MPERAMISAEQLPAQHASDPLFNRSFQQNNYRSIPAISIQTKLTIGAVDDPLEDEADAMADKIMRMPQPSLIQRKCAHCEDEEMAQRKPLSSFIQRKKTPDNNHASEFVSSNIESAKGSGNGLQGQTKSFMESRFGTDFSGVHIHTGDYAVQMSKELNAQAFTVGNDIYFNEGKYQPESFAGKHLLAHELTHTVQQGASRISTFIQRDEFAGAPGQVARDRDRPLVGYAGPMPYTANPGGTIIPNTATTAQNCAGDSCSINRYINWPHLGIEIPNMNVVGATGNWAQAINFVPTGCTRVNCSGIDVNNTRCSGGELEAIVFLYKWPVALKVNGIAVMGTQSDFHMIARNHWPSGWHSKMDRREKVIDIRDPFQSLFSAYPHTRQPDRIIQQLCFCCNQSAINII